MTASQEEVNQVFELVIRSVPEGLGSILARIAIREHTTAGQVAISLRDDLGRTVLHVAARQGDVGTCPATN